MAVDNFIPEIWSAQLLSSLKKSLVYAGPGVISRDYEGDIANQGDTVRITSISQPTIAPYVKNSTTITPETLTDAQQNLLIDQANYFAFEVDDIDYRQTADGGALMTEAADESGYGLADAADQFVAALYSDIDAGNDIGGGSPVTVASSADAVAALIDLKVALDDAKVRNDGRFVVVSPWFHGRLLGSDLFVRADASGSADTLRNGMVGRAFGFDVLLSHNTPTVLDDSVVIAGVPGAWTYAEQILKTEAFRPEDSFSDALKGLHVFGSKVIRPTSLAFGQMSPS